MARLTLKRRCTEAENGRLWLPNPSIDLIQPNYITNRRTQFGKAAASLAPLYHGVERANAATAAMAMLLMSSDRGYAAQKQRAEAEAHAARTRAGFLFWEESADPWTVVDRVWGARRNGKGLEVVGSGLARDAGTKGSLQHHDGNKGMAHARWKQEPVG